MNTSLGLTSCVPLTRVFTSLYLSPNLKNGNNALEGQGQVKITYKNAGESLSIISGPSTCSRNVSCQHYYYDHCHSKTFCLHLKKFKILEPERTTKALQREEIKMSIGQTMHSFLYDECQYTYRFGHCKRGLQECLQSAEGVLLRNDHKKPGTFLSLINTCPGSDSRWFSFLLYCKLYFYINLIRVQLTHNQMHTFQVHSFDESGQTWPLPWSHSYYDNQGNEQYPHTRKFSYTPCQSWPTHTPGPRQPLFYFLSRRLDLPVLGLQINKSKECVFFCVWLLLFSLMFIKFSFVACAGAPFSPNC